MYVYIGMINWRGWICIALVIFASWRPGKALAGALLFAAFEALQIRVQQASSAVIPYQFFLMMPYVLRILAMIIMSRRAAYPQALLVPFRKGERLIHARPHRPQRHPALRRKRAGHRRTGWPHPRSATEQERKSDG